jgi:hypothetical protein
MLEILEHLSDLTFNELKLVVSRSKPNTGSDKVGVAITFTGCAFSNVGSADFVGNIVGPLLTAFAENVRSMLVWSEA